MSEEWSDWIEHDGKGCTVKGKWVHVIMRNGHELETVAGRSIIDERGRFTRRSGPRPFNSWVWGDGGPEGNKVIRYRIRKPRSMTILERIAADPQPVKESA